MGFLLKFGLWKCQLDSWNTNHESLNQTLKTSTHIDLDIENNDKDPKFEVSDLVRISKYIKTNWSEENFMIKKILKMFCGLM